MTFQYEILVGRNNPANPSSVVWYRGSNMTSLGAELVHILNQFGAQGWEVVATGDLGYDGRTEIILKKQV